MRETAVSERNGDKARFWPGTLVQDCAAEAHSRTAETAESKARRTANLPSFWEDETLHLADNGQANRLRQ